MGRPQSGKVKMEFRKATIALLAAAMTFAAPAASRIRLIYGKGWNRASEDLKKMLESAKFKAACKGKYTTEFVDWQTGNGPDGGLGSLKIPCIFVVDEKNRCYFVFENVPYDYPGENLLRALDGINARRAKIEAEGMNTADQCGKLLQSMEKFVGGPKRVISKGFYSDVFDKLVQLDPGDKEGWIRHFKMGDGIELVIKANEFREKKDMAGGERFIESEMKKPIKHLTTEQRQGLLMAKFALYREEPSKNEEMMKILRTVAEYDEDTFWGTCALGWLNWKGQPILSTYWGWHKGDFKGPQFNTTVKYGVKHSFRKPGEYEIKFEPTEGNITVSSVTLMIGDEEVTTLKKEPFTVKVDRRNAGRINRLVVKGTTGSDSEGKINIHRRVLKPRKEK